MSSPVVQARTGSGSTFESGSHHGVIGTEWSQDRWQNRAPDHVYSIVAIPSMRPGGYTTHTTEGEMVRTYLDVGENPPADVIVTYRLVETPDVPLALVVRDAGGEEVRTFSSRTADDPPQAKERRAPTGRRTTMACSCSPSSSRSRTMLPLGTPAPPTAPTRCSARCKAALTSRSPRSNGCWTTTCPLSTLAWRRQSWTPCSPTEPGPAHHTRRGGELGH